MTQKERLLARSNNKLYNFILEDGQIQGAIIHGTHMIDEMRVNHELGILETMVLGRAYLGISLMTANLKDNDRVAFKIECAGPIKGLSVEANAFGEVRGYLKNNPIPIEKPLESFDLAPFFGDGFLAVTRYPEFALEPLIGQVRLKYGSIAGDLANYFLLSQQTAAAFRLSVTFDPGGNVTGAGGLFLYTLPNSNAGNKRIEELENLVHSLPSLGDVLSANQHPEDFITSHFSSFSPKHLSNRRVEFFCQCKKETIGRIITRLPMETLEDIMAKGPFPVEILCHNCNTVYQFDKSEIEVFYQRRRQPT